MVSEMTLGNMEEHPLEQQFQDELRQHAKSYGLAVLERLQQVDAFTFEDPGGAHAGASRAHLRRVGDGANDWGWIPDDRGERASSENRPVHTAAIHFSAEEEAGLTSGRPVLHLTSDQPARILLVRQSSGGRGPRWAATVDPAYLWANPEAYPLMTDFCVVSDSLQVVRCSRDMPGELLSKLVTPAKQGGSGSVRWSTTDDTYRAAVWPLFIQSHFIGESWNVIAIQPEGYALKAEREFRSGFMPIAVVTLLLVLLASTVQIRRVLHPLRQLLAGTRRIAAQDFTAYIPTRDRDELDELASSFNTMASQLGFYFRTQTALTEIDHTILTSLDMRRIAEIALGCIEEIIAVDASAIGLPRSTAGQICVHARRRGEPVAATPVNMSFDFGAVQPRGSHLALQWLEPEDGDPMRGCFDELRSTPRLHSVLPIARAERVLGVLVLGNGAPVALDADHLAQLASVVDRLAIAILSEQRERQLLDRARYDSLTRLPNRYYLTELTEAALARARRADRLLAVLFVDLDRFKLTNDTLGHSAGDMLLQCAAERIRQAVRDGDIVARPGGDEFIIVLSDLPDEKSAADVAAKRL
jgi:diguanylate cyclase